MRGRRYAPAESSQVYPVLTWVLSLLVGATLNVVVLSFLAYILTLLSPVYAFWFWFVLLAAFLFLPIFLASLMTELGPTRIIMPPSYIQALTAGWFLVTISTGGFYWFLPSTGLAIVLVLFAVLGAALDDLLTPKTLGYAYGLAKLPIRCLVADARLNDIQDRIMNDPQRRIIGLQKDPVETERGVLLRTDGSEAVQVFVMLSKGQADNQTKVIITAFKKEQYQITAPDAAKELVREKTLYIAAILSKPEEPEAKAITVAEQTDEARLIKDGELVTSFIRNEEAIGLFEKVSRISTNAWARIGLFATSYIVPLWFYMTHDTTSAFGTFATITATLAILSGVQLSRKKTK